jgi:hypothetical protein
MTFGDPIDVGDPGEKITGLAAYDDPKTLYVLKEGSLHKVVDNVVYPIPLDEMFAARSEYNGRAHCNSDAYLVFSFGTEGGVMRYFRQSIDSIGLNRDLGLKYDNRGPVSSLVSMPGGKIYMAVKGNVYSGIYYYDNGGRHNIFIGTAEDEIRNMYVQNIPGQTLDRLWFGMGKNILWMPLLDKPAWAVDYYGTTTDGYRFCGDAWLMTSWISASLFDVIKAWYSVKAFFHYVDEYNWLEISYRTSNTSGWTHLTTALDTMPSESVVLSSATPSSLKSEKIQLRLRLTGIASNTLFTPIITAFVLKCYGIMPPKYAYSWMVNITESEASMDLQGEEISTLGNSASVEAALTVLDGWVSGQTPLTMRSIFSPYDNKTVLLDPIPARSLVMRPEDNIEAHIVAITANEI